MKLSDRDLSDLDEEDLLNLPEEVLRFLSIHLLNDLKEAREHLNQNSHNSFCPPSSEAPWEKEINKDESESVEADNNADQTEQNPDKESSHKPEQTEDNVTAEKRKPGKQPGAQGFGRQQTLAVTDYKDHPPEQCEICHQSLNTNHKKAHTAFETVDIE